MASERVEAVESAMAAWVGVAAAAVPRTKAASGQSPEGTRIAWVEASMGGARAVDRVVVAVAVGAEVKVPAKAAATMGTTEAVTMG